MPKNTNTQTDQVLDLADVHLKLTEMVERFEQLETKHDETTEIVENLNKTTDELQETVKQLQTSLKKVRKKEKKQTKDPKKPKKSKSAYHYFCVSIKDTLQQHESKNRFKIQGQLWAEAKDKNGPNIEEFNELAKQDKQRFNDEMDNFKHNCEITDDDDSDTVNHPPPPPTVTADNQSD